MSNENNKKAETIFTEKTFRQILDAIEDLIFVKGDKSRLLWANKAFCDYYGMTNEQLLGLFGSPVETPDLTQQYIRDDLKVFSTGKSVNIPQEPIIRYDGVPSTFHTVKSPIFNDQNKVVMSVGVSRNIQSQLEIQEKLARNESFLQAILDNTPAVVYAKDLNGRYTMINKQYENVFNLKRENVVGQTDYEIFGKEFAEAFAKNDTSVVQTGKDIQCEEYAPQTDGIHTYISTKFPLRGDNGEICGVCGISTDVTERVKIRQQLEEEKAKGLAQERLLSLGEMAGGIAHEINTPLAALKTLCGQLVELTADDGLDPKIVNDIALLMEKTTDRISGVIKNLRAVSRDGSKDPYVEFKVLDMVNETLSLCREKFVTKDMHLEVRVPSTLTLEARSVEVSQVLFNLVSNALDAVAGYTDKWIKIEAKDLGAMVEISVIDSGVGINKIEEQKIFQPFFTTKEIGQGTGLGLSISKRIADQHGGRLFVDHDCSNTKLTVHFPKHQNNAKLKKIS